MNRHDEQNAQAAVAFLVARGVVFSYWARSSSLSQHCQWQLG